MLPLFCRAEIVNNLIHREAQINTINLDIVLPKVTISGKDAFKNNILFILMDGKYCQIECTIKRFSVVIPFDDIKVFPITGEN